MLNSRGGRGGGKEEKGREGISCLRPPSIFRGRGKKEKAITTVPRHARAGSNRGKERSAASAFLTGHPFEQSKKGEKEGKRGFAAPPNTCQSVEPPPKNRKQRGEGRREGGKGEGKKLPSASFERQLAVDASTRSVPEEASPCATASFLLPLSRIAEPARAWEKGRDGKREKEKKRGGRRDATPGASP